MIRCECPHCAQILEFTDDYADQVAACPHCNNSLTVPSAIPMAAPAIPIQPPSLPRFAPGMTGATATAGPSQTCGLAVASVTLGITSFLCFGPLCAIPGIITGHMALSEIRKTPRELKGQGMATTGLILSYVNVAIAALVFLCLIAAPILLPVLSDSNVLSHDPDAAGRATCQNNLKQMGLVFKMFAGENKNLFPELNPQSGRLIFANSAPGSNPMFPDFFSDYSILSCPSDESAEEPPAEAGQAGPQDVFDRSSYTYLGYVVTNEAELKAFVQVYKDRLAKGLRFDEDLDVPPGTGTGGGDKILRLREGVERFIITDINNPRGSASAQSSIPIMWDTVSGNPGSSMTFNHIPGGADVLFMDGHVEFIKYPGRFPLTPEAVQLLSELEAIQ
ncbi:MAG: DUF4190 domain-containing protein [Candidatus Hydrogenedentes bacterium]|nr:DUF4190 domain-containing protein [Candidatus Hydrogenedentota bacterium]